MPVELHDVNEFLKVAERASECRVKRLGDVVKLKLRTKRYLYTLKVDAKLADEILEKVKGLNLRVVEV